MSASMNMDIMIVKGGEEAQEAIEKAICEIEGYNYTNKIGVKTGGGITISLNNAQFNKVFGDDFLNPDASVYLELAKAMPSAEWFAHSYRVYEGGGEGCEAVDDAAFKDGILHYSRLGSFDSLSFDGLCDTMINPYGDIEDNMESLREEENSFYLAGRLKYGLKKTIEDIADDRGYNLFEDMPEEAEDNFFVICDSRKSGKYEEAKRSGIPVLSSADFIVLFIGCDEYEDWAGDADVEFDSSEFSEDYQNHVTFDAVKLVFNVDDKFEESEFEELRKTPNDGEMVLQDDFLSTETYSEVDRITYKI